MLEVSRTRFELDTSPQIYGQVSFFIIVSPKIFFKDPIYLQSVIIHSANGGKGEGWHVEEYSVALLC
jgi:hypothetical protein